MEALCGPLSSPSLSSLPPQALAAHRGGKEAGPPGERSHLPGQLSPDLDGHAAGYVALGDLVCQLLDPGLQHTHKKQEVAAHVSGSTHTSRTCGTPDVLMVPAAAPLSRRTTKAVFLLAWLGQATKAAESCAVSACAGAALPTSWNLRNLEPRVWRCSMDRTRLVLQRLDGHSVSGMNVRPVTSCRGNRAWCCTGS